MLRNWEFPAHLVVLARVFADDGVLVTVSPPPQHKVEVVLCVDGIVHVG